MGRPRFSLSGSLRTKEGMSEAKAEDQRQRTEEDEDDEDEDSDGERRDYEGYGF